MKKQLILKNVIIKKLLKNEINKLLKLKCKTKTEKLNRIN